MSVANLSSMRMAGGPEVERVAQLAVSLSGRLRRVHLEEIAPAIAEALGDVAAAMHADGCQLLEFTESGALARTHVASAIERPASQSSMAGDTWFVERLSRGDLVDISRPDNLPPDAGPRASRHGAQASAQSLACRPPLATRSSAGS